jgi:hypothetical protein
MNNLEKKFDNKPMVSSDNDSSMSKVMTVNNLKFDLGANLSVATSMSYKQYFFDRSSYDSGETEATCTIQSGVEYLQPRDCYLKFRLRVKEAGSDSADYFFGENGSAVNCIENITIHSRSGQEVERISRVNQLRSLLDLYQCDTNALENTNYGRQNQSSLAAQTTFCIPMHKLCGLFDSHQPMPSHLAQGLQVKIDLSSGRNAFQTSTASEDVSFVMENPVIVCKQYKLADNIQRKLASRASSSRGLEYVFKTWDVSHYSIDASTSSLFVSVRKAISKGSKVLLATRRQSYKDTVTQNWLRTENYDYKNWQARNGSHYIPSHPVKDQAESYCITQQTYNKYGCHGKQNSVNPEKYTDNAGALGITLERSSILDLSGQPISSARSLDFEVEYANAHDRLVSVGLEYTRVARLYLDSVLIKE